MIHGEAPFLSGDVGDAEFVSTSLSIAGTMGGINEAHGRVFGAGEARFGYRMGGKRKKPTKNHPHSAGGGGG